jgi:hypothetical protein
MFQMFRIIVVTPNLAKILKVMIYFSRILQNKHSSQMFCIIRSQLSIVHSRASLVINILRVVVT